MAPPHVATAKHAASTPPWLMPLLLLSERRVGAPLPPMPMADAAQRAIATDGAAARGDGQACSRHAALGDAAAARVGAPLPRIPKADAARRAIAADGAAARGDGA